MKELAFERIFGIVSAVQNDEQKGVADAGNQT